VSGRRALNARRLERPSSAPAIAFSAAQAQSIPPTFQEYEMKTPALKLSVQLAALVGGLCLAGSAFATEGGSGPYPNGANSWMEGALPPPGNYVLPYVGYYTADRFNGENGRELIPNFNVKVSSATLRLTKIWDQRFFGATVGSQLIQPFLNVDVHAAGAHDKRFGAANLMITPVILGVRKGDFFLAGGLDVYLPTGTYDRHRLANPSTHYWTLTPDLGVTYRSQNGLEASAKLMYDVNLKNDATGYASGDAFHADYRVAYSVTPALALGVEGYTYVQVSEDKLNGVTVGPDGFKGRVYGIGPAVTYMVGGKMPVMASWKHEFGARNRPEGDVFWLRTVAPF
jgi:hypothetical protein